MRFLLVFSLTWIAAYFTLLIFPWWIPALVAFIVILLFRVEKTGTAILAPALGNLCCWIMLLLIRDIPNQHLLSRKIAALFQLPSYVFLIAISGFIGFITAGLGGWVATCLLTFLKPRSRGCREEAKRILHK